LSLTSVTFPNCVSVIDNLAFSGCDALTKVTSLNIVPPIVGIETFDYSHYVNATLEVPEEAEEAYRVAYGWKKFYDPSGVDELVGDGGIEVVAADGRIVVAGVEDGAEVNVYSINGQLVYKGEDTTINVPASGMYIVRVAGQTFKVAL